MLVKLTFLVPVEYNIRRVDDDDGDDDYVAEVLDGSDDGDKDISLPKG